MPLRENEKKSYLTVGFKYIRANASVLIIAADSQIYLLKS
jgi:hypothetical protein